MRLLVMYDLPVEKSSERKEYRKFHKFLTSEGYIQQQESIYSKLCLNQNAAEAAVEKLKKHKPKYGLVQILRITEKQYASMEFICGKPFHTELDTTERVVIL